MPKCESCQYLRRTSYEYSEYECAIFGDYQGEDKWNPDMFTNEGCKYTQKALAKKYKKVDYRKGNRDDTEDIKIIVEGNNEQRNII